MAALRAALGIPPEVYTDFAQLRRKVLEKAKAEIDQLAHFRVEWREIRQGRTVVEIEFRFEPKGAPEVIETVDELDRHSSGRTPRRTGKVDTVVESIETAPGRLDGRSALKVNRSIDIDVTFLTGRSVSEQNSFTRSDAAKEVDGTSISSRRRFEPKWESAS